MSAFRVCPLLIPVVVYERWMGGIFVASAAPVDDHEVGRLGPAGFRCTTVLIPAGSAAKKPIEILDVEP
jgi:hypothetical protein